MDPIWSAILDVKGVPAVAFGLTVYAIKWLHDKITKVEAKVDEMADDAQKRHHNIELVIQRINMLLEALQSGKK